jgi:hypothetical protein
MRSVRALILVVGGAESFGSETAAFVSHFNVQRMSKTPQPMMPKIPTELDIGSCIINNLCVFNVFRRYEREWKEIAR